MTEPMYYASNSRPLKGKAKAREVYLPEKADWYDFWTGTKYEGGQKILADAPLEKIPIFVPEEEWKEITGDSFIVDIRSLRNRKRVILYVLGYLSSKTKVEETWEDGLNDLFCRIRRPTRRIHLENRPFSLLLSLSDHFPYQLGHFCSWLYWNYASSSTHYGLLHGD
ncbi:hypothetical protein AKJ41_03820 [candidate division MSBL1 archaeon SCGC-AAA259O05]|uniref:Glycosyl hydrolase family 31 C-terminal domain-containing protein n=1 Tax=candidate division MSBL1 archaeon SCGC-AAA259O05 TaxID=1698271 RepID=A0A133V2K7_9EURY|nr:hypothetical protein AKJ41_03820 [candidate division MSBL1 archaeon SCGC-AAA259O05]